MRRYVDAALKFRLPGMVIVNLKGGLGNQMFQYAFAYRMAKERKTDLYVDLRYLAERRSGAGYAVRDYNLNIFGIEPKLPTKTQLMRVGMRFGDLKMRFVIGKALDRLGAAVIAERSYSFDKRVFGRDSNAIYLDGYWQSEKYFDMCADDIARIFAFDTSTFKEDTLRLAEIIKAEHAVCVHVRRGDFVGSKNCDVVGLDYYTKALDVIRKAHGDSFKVYVFSDDIEWCRVNMKIWPNLQVVGGEREGDRFAEDMYLMTQCSAFVIPNSTFSWWAAWLSRARNKLVIAPKVWSGLEKLNPLDIVPEKWIRI